MSKPDLSIQVRLTPSQAAAILAAMREAPGTGWSQRWRAIHAGARARGRSALLGAGWREDGEWWEKDE